MHRKQTGNVLDSKTYLQLGRYNPISTSRGALGGANNDFKANNYCFMKKKVGCDRATSPLYEPGVHLRFEICTPTLFLVFIDNIYGLHLKGETNILSQNLN